MDKETRRAIICAQRNEITEHHLYKHLAARNSGKNRQVLNRIAADEKRHYDFWRKLSGSNAGVKRLTLWWYLFIAHTLGYVFAIRLMERGEDLAQYSYERLKQIPGVERIIKDEQRHEVALIDLLREERLDYAGSMVLGLNDALVELTGALAGLTLAIRDSTIVAIAGLVTGIAASLSMAASEYLASEEEEGEKHSGKAALYTGIAYILTVIILIAPYFIFSNIYVSLGVTLCAAVAIIFAYTFYITTAKNIAFWPRFLRMAAISLGVAGISFLVGILLRATLGVEA